MSLETNYFIKAFINETWMRRYGIPVPHEKQTLMWSLLVSMFSIGGLMGSLMCLCYRKKCQLYNCLLPLASALLMGLSRTVNSFEMILVGRYLSGFNSGLGINIHAQFLGEMAPRKLRGFVNTTGAVFITFGKMCGQVVGLRELFGTEALWHHILLVSGLISFLQLVTLPFFPESPTYLLLDKGDKDGCVRALKQLWGDTDHQPYIDEMMKEQVSIKNVRKMSILELLKDPSHRCQLFVSICLIFCMQLSGVNAIYFYSYDVFQEAGFPENQIAYVSLGVGVFEFISSLICSLLIDRFGRKVLIYGGYSLMILTLGLLTVSLSLQESLKQFCFLLFMAITALFLVCTYFFVPETKDKTIEEISQEFNKFNFRKQFKENKTAISECTLGTRL
uniref:Major facilitator superfamily (MFS) profile domain-containing protein n=1 Tax=Leptobrachium leishanense TaxID=445787 RepID=A0A8C5P6E6_9ANUR